MSPPDPVRRARPLLGTLVSIEATSDPTDAFAEIERIHALMSFHEPSSDLSRLNREAASHATQVDPDTFAVLAFAARMRILSEGVFDIAIAPALVRSGLLPRPRGAPDPDPHASAADIELDAARLTVRFHRPLWIDLGGVAKGYAVDRAVQTLQQQGVTQGCVNAGGDLRVFGDETQTILLRSKGASYAPKLRLHAAGLASSAIEPVVPVHYDGATRAPAAHCDFASVVADTCMSADVLTKVVLAQGGAAAPVVDACNATAYFKDAAGWHMIGREQ